MNVPLVLGILGRLLVGFSCAMFFPFAMAVVNKEASLQAFFFSMIITGCLGIIMLQFKNPSNERMGIRESFVIVAAACGF